MGVGTVGALRRLTERLSDTDEEDRAGSLGPSFLLRGRDGRIEDAAHLSGGFERLCLMLERGTVSEIGDSYALVTVGPRDEGAGAWLVCLSEEKIGAALEFDHRATAIEAVPPSVRDRSAREVMEEAVWAFVRRDVAKLMALLAPDFSYTDSVRGTTLSGAPQVVNGLLLTFSDLAERGIADLELSELTNEMVRAEGVLTRSLGEDPATKWRWRTISAVVDGRVRWTVREPDTRVDEDR